MAEQTGDDIFKTIMSRADGGLLALNIGALTFLAGLTKLSDIGSYINVGVLMGGLCVALFFAILCAYYTFFGGRATADEAASMDDPVNFEPQLAIVSPNGHRTSWLLRFLVVLFLLFGPLIPLWHSFEEFNADQSRFFEVVGIVDQNLANEGCSASSPTFEQQAQKPEAGVCKSIRGLSVTLNGIAGETLDRQNRDIEMKIAILMCAYLAAPVLFWIFGPWAFGYLRLPAARLTHILVEENGSVLQAMRLDMSREADASKTNLMRRMEAIQTLRTGTALISLAAFLLSVSIALIHTGVLNASAGLQTASAPVPEGSNIMRSGNQYVVLSAPARDAPAPQVNVTVPDKIVVQYPLPQPPMSGSGQDPQTSLPVRIEGLDNIKVQLEVQPGRSVPAAQVIKLEGLKGEKGDSGKNGNDGQKADLKLATCEVLWVHYRCVAVPQDEPDSPAREKTAASGTGAAAATNANSGGPPPR